MRKLFNLKPYTPRSLMTTETVNIIIENSYITDRNPFDESDHLTLHTFIQTAFDIHSYDDFNMGFLAQMLYDHIDKSTLPHDFYTGIYHIISPDDFHFYDGMTEQICLGISKDISRLTKNQINYLAFNCLLLILDYKEKGLLK